MNLGKEQLEACKTIAKTYFGQGEQDEDILELRKKGIKFPGLLYTKKEKIDMCESIEAIILYLGERSTLNYLNLLHSEKVLEEQMCADLLYENWVSLEIIHNNGMSKEKLLKLMKMAEKEPEMVARINKLSSTNKVLVYRGAGNSRESSHEGLSWTIDKEKAIWFANRFSMLGRKGYLYSGIIDKKDIFAFIESRRESEVVCDYRMIKNLKKVCVSK